MCPLQIYTIVCRILGQSCPIIPDIRSCLLLHTNIHLLSPCSQLSLTGDNTVINHPLPLNPSTPYPQPFLFLADGGGGVSQNSSSFFNKGYCHCLPPPPFHIGAELDLSLRTPSPTPPAPHWDRTSTICDVINVKPWRNYFEDIIFKCALTAGSLAINSAASREKEILIPSRNEPGNWPMGGRRSNPSGAPVGSDKKRGWQAGNREWGVSQSRGRSRPETNWIFITNVKVVSPPIQYITGVVILGGYCECCYDIAMDIGIFGMM